MAFCTSCGNQIGETDRFCARCGGVQSAHGAQATPPPPSPSAQPPSSNPQPPPPGQARPVPPGAIRPNIAAMLCYIPNLGWIASVLFLASESHKHDRYVRFHAFQGLFLQAAALLFSVAFAVAVPFHPFIPFRHFGMRSILELLVLVAQIIGIVKTVQFRDYRLPVVGDLAEKSMA